MVEQNEDVDLYLDELRTLLNKYHFCMGIFQLYGAPPDVKVKVFVNDNQGNWINKLDHKEDYNE